MKKINVTKPNIFVETGTYLGDGIYNVINDFDKIHSIELSQKFYDDAVKKFSIYKKVKFHHGDSAEVLEKCFVNIDEPIMFFLDAHYSGGETEFGRDEENGIPLLRELTSLGKRKFRDIIIIDDVRLFGKISQSGIEGSTIYPITIFDFRNVTLNTILTAYNRDCKYFLCEDWDRLVILPD